MMQDNDDDDYDDEDDDNATAQLHVGHLAKSANKRVWHFM